MPKLYGPALGLGLGLKGPGLDLGLEGPGLGFECPGLGLECPGLVNIPDARAIPGIYCVKCVFAMAYATPPPMRVGPNIGYM